LWKLLDSPAFDKAVAGAKSAAIAYATKKATDYVKGAISASVMGRKQKKAIQVVQKFGQPAAGKGKLVLVPAKRQAMPRARSFPGRGVGGRRRNGPPASKMHSVPVARARTSTTQAPRVGGRGPVTVSHTEYIQEVQGSIGFNVTPFFVNPGLPGSFPWLANIASQYEEYRVKKLVYRFETEASSSVAGAVILVTDVDALDTAFQSKQQAMDYRGASRTAPWQRVTHDAQAAAKSPYGARYVRSGSIVSGDLKTYDVGLFQLITQGMASTAVVGELYVDYTFEFIGPKVNNVLGQNLLGADVRSGGVVTPAAPLGSAPSIVGGSNIPIVVNNNSVTFQFSGRLLVTFQIIGTGITVLSVNAAGGASAAVIYSNVITATTANAVVSIDLVANQGQGITLSVTGTTVTSSILMVQQMSSGLLLAPKKQTQSGALPLWTPPDPLLEKIARLEAILARASLVEEEERRQRSYPSAALVGQTGRPGY